MKMDLADNFDFQLPTHVIARHGAASDIGKICADSGYSSAFVIADPALHKLGVLDEAFDSLDSAGVTYRVCTELKPNPIDADVERVAARFAEAAESLVIGVGGGSAQDTAKGVAMLAANRGRLRDYNGNGKVPSRCWPLMLIPTTAGTGSEVSASISVTAFDTFDKLAVRDFNNCAWFAVLDPALLAGLPASVAAATGADALTHAVESYVSNRHTVMSRLFAYEAARRIGTSLVAFVEDRTDLFHATNMLYGSCLAAVAFSHTGTGNAHAVSRALGGRYDITHGRGCGVALEHVMRFNRDADPEGYVDLAEAFGVHDPTLRPHENADRAIARVAHMRESIGLPAALDLRVTDDALEELAEWTVANSTPNPRRTSLQDARQLLRAVVPA